MKSKPIGPRELANQNVDEAIKHYLSEDAAQAAPGFIDALEQAFVHIARRHATGSPRYAHDLGLPGLRSSPLRRYPHQVFHIERSDHIEGIGESIRPGSLLGPPGRRNPVLEAARTARNASYVHFAPLRTPGGGDRSEFW